MKRIRRDRLNNKISKILHDNSGASLLLVSVIAIIVLTAVVILRVSTSTFMASSTRQLNQDQAYELAASLGESIDIMIESGEFDIQKLAVSPTGTTVYSSADAGYVFVGLPDASVNAVVTDMNEGTEVIGKRLTVTAYVGDAEYTYIKDYRK